MLVKEVNKQLVSYKWNTGFIINISLALFVGKLLQILIVRLEI